MELCSYDGLFYRNRCFNNCTGQTPYFLLTGRKPNLNKMNIFGTVCYGYINDYKKKLDARSRCGIFVGFDKNSSSYLIYYPDDKTVKKHRMVTFTDLFIKDMKQQECSNEIRNNELTELKTIVLKMMILS